MRYATYALALCLLDLVITVGLCFALPLARAEAVAEKVAPQIGVSDDLLRPILLKLFQASSFRESALHVILTTAITAVLLFGLYKNWRVPSP